MNHSEIFGEVRDNDKGSKKLRAKPKTAIGKFYAEKGNELITHWCKPCKRWHGPSCFHVNHPAAGGKRD